MMPRWRRVGAGLVIAVLATSAVSLGLPRPGRAALIAVAVADSYTAVHDRTYTRPAPGVLGNDLNLLGGSSVTLVAGVSHGTLQLRSDGSFTYVPAAGYVGGDSFRYRISGLLTTPATVTLTVTNKAPVARADGYSTPSKTLLVIPAPGVLANDTDGDGDSLSAEIVSASGISGSLDLEPNGRLVYSPGGGASGTVSFTYRVWDGIAWSSPNTVAITVAAPTPTPTPTATPTPAPTTTPKPTLRATPRPTPRPTPPSTPRPTTAAPGATVRPVPTPDQQGGPGAAPAGAPEDPRPGASGTARPSEAGASPKPSDADGAGRSTPVADADDEQPDASGGAGGALPGDPSGRSPAAGPAGQAGPRIAIDQAGVELALGNGGFLAGGMLWAVPAAALTVPGLLLLIWLGLQAAGALAWIPAVRRLRGDEPATG